MPSPYVPGQPDAFSFAMMINLLAEIRDLLMARPLPAVPYEQLAAMMGRFSQDGFPAAQTTPLTPPYGTMSAVVAEGLMAAALPLPPERPHVSFVRGPNGELPDPVATPGALNDAVTDATIKETIGTPGWTATVRPPVSYTNALKIQVMREYGIVGNPADFELDHLVPLCAGGNPVSQLNLWAQRRAGINGASVKDITESWAQHAILGGHLTLAEVRQGFMTDWTQLHAKMAGNAALMASVMLATLSAPEQEP